MSAGFQCKKFYVAHDRCAMKVGTDGLLLGAWAPVPAAGNILDIGSGSGLISLMLAQRSNGVLPITAIELDSDAAEQACENVARSYWPNTIRLIKGDILTYQPGERYRLIVSNPPFFQQSLGANDARRHQARHTDSLPFAALLRKAADLLHDQGLFSVILPRAEAEFVLQLAMAEGWYLAQRCEVRSKAEKPVQRSLFSLSLKPQITRHGTLIVHQADGNYSADYKALLRDFYLKF